MIIAQVDAPGLVGIAARVGVRRPLPNSASGHVLLAFQEPSVREEWLHATATGSRTAAGKRALERRLQLVARRGYEEHSSPWMKGVVGISSPVCNLHGHAIATVTASFAPLSGRHPPLRELRTMVMESAAQMTRDLGGVTPFVVPSVRASSLRNGVASSARRNGAVSGSRRHGALGGSRRNGAVSGTRRN
jgi:DNA-binding IclR family transcriptional regulator